MARKPTGRPPGRPRKDGKPPGSSSAAVAKVLPFGPRPTFGPALAALRPSVAPAAETPAPPSNPPETAPGVEPPASPPVELPQPPPAPPPLDPDDDEETRSPAAATGPRNEDAESFSELAGTITTSFAVVVMADQIRKRGREPNIPDDTERDRCARSIAKCIARGIGDGPIPWWAPPVCGLANLYLSMRMGAERIEPAAAGLDAAPAVTDAVPPIPAAPPPAPAPPAVGRKFVSAKPAPIPVTSSPRAA